MNAKDLFASLQLVVGSCLLVVAAPLLAGGVVRLRPR